MLTGYSCSSVKQQLSSCWDGWPFGHNRHGPRLGPHLTKCHMGRGIPPYQVVSRSIQPFGHNRHWPKVGAAVPLSVEGAGSPSNTMSLGRGLLPYHVASWSIQLFGHNRHGPKSAGAGCCAPFWGLDSNLTQCGLASWSIQPFGHNTPTLQTDRQAGQSVRTDNSPIA